MPPRLTLNSRLAALVVALLVASDAEAMPIDTTPSNSPPQSSITQAVTLNKAGKHAQAEALLRTVVAAQPADADAWSQLGFALRKQERYDAALDAYGRALTLAPYHPEANEYLGELYLEQNRLAEAKDRLTALRVACPTDCESRAELEQMIRDYERRQGN